MKNNQNNPPQNFEQTTVKTKVTPSFRAGFMVKNKSSGDIATIIAGPYTHCFMECDPWGNDISYAASCITLMYHGKYEGQTRRNLSIKKARACFDLLPDSYTELGD